MHRYSTLWDALGHVERIEQQPKAVAALLYFSSGPSVYPTCGPSYVFEATEDPRVEVKKSLSIRTGVAPFDDPKFESQKYKDIFFLAKDVVSQAIANVFVQKGLSVSAGHAEEWLIHHFNTALAEQSDPRIVTIHVTFNPCTMADRFHSTNLHGWPASCGEKLKELARRHPNLTFSVGFDKGYGAYTGKPEAAEAFLNTGCPKNLTFESFG